jgi:AraC-like DNA-binding protein
MAEFASAGMRSGVSGRCSSSILARAAGMSRTSFAARFRMVGGIPPLAYLSR